MKKILAALAASAFALTLYAGHATACPGHSKATAEKTKKESDKTVTDTKKKDDKKKDEKKKAPAKAKVS